MSGKFPPHVGMLNRRDVVVFGRRRVIVHHHDTAVTHADYEDTGERVIVHHYDTAVTHAAYEDTGERVCFYAVTRLGQAPRAVELPPLPVCACDHPRPYSGIHRPDCPVAEWLQEKGH